MMRKDDVLRRTGTDWVVEGVTIACVVAILVSFGFYGHIDADEAFPMHYNAAGEVDGWGTRSALWIFGGVALAVCLLLTIGERFYKKFNYPVRVTEKNREWLWRLAVRMFRVVKMVIMLFFTYIFNMRGFGSPWGMEAALAGTCRRCSWRSSLSWF